MTGGLHIREAAYWEPLSRQPDHKLRHVGDKLAILAGMCLNLAHPSVQSHPALDAGPLDYGSCIVQAAEA